MAARIAAESPGTIAHVVALGGLARMSSDMSAARLRTADLLSQGHISLQEVLDGARLSVAEREDRDEATDRLVRERLAGIGLDELVWNLRLTAPMTDPARAVRAFETHATILHGRRDGAVPVESGEELASLGKNARFVVLDTSSHLLPLTHASTVAAEIRAVLDTPWRAQPSFRDR
jgi:pimeloyl-ACP methyl ester carboxylesterase